MDEEQVDYVICTNCDTPSYIFDLDPRTRRITAAICQLCGNDEPKGFRLPADDEVEE